MVKDSPKSHSTQRCSQPLPSVLPTLHLGPLAGRLKPTALCLEPFQSPRERQDAGVGLGGFSCSPHTPTVVEGLSRLSPISNQS